MSLFWYPELNEKYTFEEAPDKGMLLTSYINYFLARLQSMFIYDGLPDTIPQKWLENLLLVNGSCVWLKTENDGLFVNRAAPAGERDVYYIPEKVIVTNPWAKGPLKEEYTRDVDCVVMVNDTYAQGLLPMLKKYCSQMVEADITMDIALIMARATAALSAADDTTKASAELWLKRLIEGRIGVIGETPFLVANQDKSLTVNNLSGSASTLTDLIEVKQYIKACLYNDIGLQSNYNMKREAINSNESQLNEDMLHPLIDTMLRERQEGVERVNAMFGTNITVRFNSAWEINEREEEAAIEQIEATAEVTENEAEQSSEVTDNDTEIPADDNNDIDNSGDSDDIEPEEAERVEEQTEETEAVEVTITEEAIEEIAEKVAEKLEDEDNADNKATE